MNILLAIAVLAAVAGAFARDITAIALLASLAFSEVLCHIGVPFNFVLWVTIDLLVVLCIIRPQMRHRDLIVLALFLPIWALYIAWPSWTPQAIVTLVSLQMLLTFPIKRTWAFLRRRIEQARGDDTMKMAMA